MKFILFDWNKIKTAIFGFEMWNNKNRISYLKENIFYRKRRNFAFGKQDFPRFYSTLTLLFAIFEVCVELPELSD